jgi:tRNA G18 (ribose-2'-O)-methylase SpoU
MAGAMRELFESSEGVVAKLLRERKELNQEMMAQLLEGANRDEQQQAAAAIAGIGVSKLNEYLAEKKYQRAKEEGNAEEVDPSRYAAEVQDSVFQRFNQLRKGQFIDYDSLENDTLNYMEEGGDKQRILNLIETDRYINSLSDQQRQAKLDEKEYSPQLTVLQQRIGKLYDPKNNPDYEINKRIFEDLKSSKIEEPEEKEGMITKTVNSNNTANTATTPDVTPDVTPDNNDKKDKDKKKGLFGFFS